MTNNPASDSLTWPPPVLLATGNTSGLSQLYTTLPAGMGDGQEILFAADPTNGVIWRLRYNAGSASSYKWEFTGGPELSQINDAVVTVNSTTYSDFTSPPTITVPLAGDYDITFGSLGLVANTSGVANIGISIGGAVPVAGVDETFCNAGANVLTTPAILIRRKTGLVAGTVVKVQMKASSSANSTGRYLRVRPVRLG